MFLSHEHEGVDPKFVPFKSRPERLPHLCPACKLPFTLKKLDAGHGLWRCGFCEAAGQGQLVFQSEQSLIDTINHYQKADA